MHSSDLVDRRARRCVTGYAEDDDDIDDTIFSDYDCNAITAVQRSSGSGDCCADQGLQSCSQRRRCFDGWSPLDEEGFPDDDELFSAIDSIIIRRARRDGSRRDDDDQPASASDNGRNETVGMVLRTELQPEIVRSESIATCAPDVLFAKLTRSLSITSITSIDLSTGDERYNPYQRALAIG